MLEDTLPKWLVLWASNGEGMASALALDGPAKQECIGMLCLVTQCLSWTISRLSPRPLVVTATLGQKQAGLFHVEDFSDRSPRFSVVHPLHPKSYTLSSHLPWQWSLRQSIQVLTVGSWIFWSLHVSCHKFWDLVCVNNDSKYCKTSYLLSIVISIDNK